MAIRFFDDDIPESDRVQVHTFDEGELTPVKPTKKDKKPAKSTIKKVVESSKVTSPPDTSILEGHNWEVEDGQPQIQMQVKPSTSLDFRSPEVSLTTTTPKLKLTPTQAKRREGESFDEFNIRASQFESAKRQQEVQEKAERAAVRSKVSPKMASMLPEVVQKYSPSPLQLLTGSDLSSAKGASLAQGVENVLAPLIRQGGLAAGIGPEETWAQGMPHLNEEESKNTGNKIVEGIGSTFPYGIASALGGMPATALLGASSNAAQTYEEALANGVSHDQALQAAIPGAIIGSLEGLMGLGTGKFVEQMGHGTVKSLIAGIGEEELQELTSQVLNNVNAKMLSGYDPNRAISEGMWDTFVTTLGTAGLAHGATLIGGGHGDVRSPLPASPSFHPTEVQQMEQRSLQAGKPVALTPETRDAYVARNQEIKQQLMTLDPASPDFARLVDEHTRLARAIDDAPETVPESTEALRKHLVEKNLGHEGAADEMLGILRPADGGGIADHPTELAARFYPNKTSDTKGGTVYLSPEALGDLFIESEGSRSGIGALNENVDKVREVAASVAESDPALSQSLLSAADEAERKGLSQVSLVSYRQGQGLPETRKLIRHESFHTGQWGALDQAGEGPDIRALHSPDVIYHPVLAKMASSETGQKILNYYEGDHDALATELAAYSAAGQYDLFGLSEADAASYLTDYLTGIAETYGPEALDALAGTARLSPTVAQKVKEISSESKPKNFGQANRDFAAQLRAQPSASGRVEGTAGGSEDSGSVESGRTAEAADQAEVGGVAGGPPPNQGSGARSEDGGGGNLYVNVLSSDVVKDISKRAGEVLKQLGIVENPLLPPHEQIMKALAEQPDKVQPAAVAAAMREQGITGEDLVKAVDEAAANAGRTMQALQQADAHWARVIKENPEWAVEAAKQGLHAFGAGPRPSAVLDEGIKDLKTSALGRSIWRRSGDLVRKMYLTRFSTASNNAVSTVPRIPLDLVDGLMTGAAMGMLDPAKWAGASDASIAEGAKAGALAGAQASMRVAMAFPDAAKKVLRMGETPSTDFNDMVIAQMEQLHPDLHSKLAGMSTGLENLKESKVKIDKLKELLPYLNDSEKQKQYAAELDLYQKRYDANHALAGKVFNKVNWAYDQFLKPGNVQEFFFRRPYFVGSLAKRAAAAGFDLNQLAQNAATLRDFANDPAGKDAVAITQLPTLADLPPEVWEAAADDALTFTYAYAPHVKGHGPIETFTHHYIKFMDALGPIGAVVDAFPKALFNGLKFAYEYSPVGMIKPVASITDEVYQGGGRKDIKYDDVSRISKAVLGTAMFAAAIGVRKELGGEEWWQIKTGKKDKKGQPIYLNVKKYMPFAGMLYLADLTLRMKDGRLLDRKPGDDLAELYLGARRADSGGTVFSESIKEISDYIASGDPLDDKLVNKGKKPLGQLLGAPLTPFINLRDLVAQFDEDEEAKRDMKEQPLLGPAIDKLPWLRSSEKYGLPLYQPPTEPAPQPSSAAPALTELGISLDPGTNFATREFARLGISPIRWLKPDPDPKINRAQYAAYAKRLALIAPKIEASPLYQSKTDAQKAAFWEAKLSGPDGLAAEAKELGQQANPQEVNRREILKSQPPLQRKASGLDKKVQEMKNKTVP